MITSAIKRNLFISFGISMLLLLISSVASYKSIKSLLNSNTWVLHTDSVLLSLERVGTTITWAESGQRGYLITSQDAFLTPYNGAKQKVIAQLNSLDELTKDNPEQQATLAELKRVADARFAALEQVIELRRRHAAIDTTYLEQGRRNMDQAALLIKVMQDRELELLEVRNRKLQQYASFTPILIVLATVLSVLITIVFFNRINKDVDRRMSLQRELEAKDEDINRRIDVIKQLAEKISAGNYEIRVPDTGKDGLGALSVALNKMTGSLQYSFNQLGDKEWQQAGIALLSEHMLGKKSVETLTEGILQFMVTYLGAQAGAFYLVQPDDRLQMVSVYALEGNLKGKEVAKGEGLAGQCFATGRPLTVKHIQQTTNLIGFAAGSVQPTCIICIPTVNEGTVNGVVELLFVSDAPQRVNELLQGISTHVGIAVDMSVSRRSLQELLEETQTQSEELQAKQEELEALNTELETQAESLQASEEELRMQQAELQQSNADLEERTRLLEEKNQIIAERNQEIQRKAAELEQSSRYKSEFLANMSHELRTPLNSILLLSRLLAENSEQRLGAEEVESATVIQSSGKALLSLIDEILDLSKIEAGKMDVNYEPVELGLVLSDMRSVFAPMAREKSLELKLDISPTAPGTLETDKMKLEQILRNLLSNALKFTERGTVALSVDFDEKGYYAIKVKDSGIGIAEDKQELVFEAFRQADGSTKRKYGGTGLGLSISRELARLLGGEIRVSSTPGAGSEFVLYLPIKKGIGSVDAIRNESNRVTGNAPRVEPNRAWKTEMVADVIPYEVADDRHSIGKGEQCILIVEDDVNFAVSLLNLTHRMGFKGIVLVRGDEVLKFATKYRPAGIMLDIKLPVKSGWDVMDELKADPLTKDIPVHIMSSESNIHPEDIVGSAGFISKPASVDALEEVFKKIKSYEQKEPQKVLIIEENEKHARALSLFLKTHEINCKLQESIQACHEWLKQNGNDCAIIYIENTTSENWNEIEHLKKERELEGMQVIFFTGRGLSRVEEARLKQYVDSIILKTVNSYQRVLDEVSLFLHHVEEVMPEKRLVSKQLTAPKDILKEKKVLLADDDVRNIYSLTRALESNGMKVYSSIDGKEALSLLKENPDIDIVLMDVMMPEMDGYETMRQIRQMPALRKLPVIAVTAKAMAEDRRKCIDAGASDYISKPVDIDQLLSLLRVWLYE